MNAVPDGWSHKRFGAENFWIKEMKHTVSLLGWGPPLHCGASTERLRRLIASAGFPFKRLIAGTQVHGSSVAHLEEGFSVDSRGTAGSCDGLMTAVTGLGLVVWTADCVPVLLDGGEAVATVHAGWRGTAAGIVTHAVDQFRILHGIRPSQISVTIGPGIGACHYPVGPEVISALEGSGRPGTSWRRGDRVDLRAFLHRQLVDLGLEESSIEIAGPCTACDARLASFRRDGRASGRQISAIGRISREHAD